MVVISDCSSRPETTITLATPHSKGAIFNRTASSIGALLMPFIVVKMGLEPHSLTYQQRYQRPQYFTL